MECARQVAGTGEMRGLLSSSRKYNGNKTFWGLYPYYSQRCPPFDVFDLYVSKVGCTPIFSFS